MAESAAHLVDHVLPHVPVRQWVLSFPWVVRYLLAKSPSLCSAVRRTFLRAVFAFYRDRARREGIPASRTGAVNRIQRFGSALNCNVHFHALLLDGVYAASSPLERPVFHPLAELTDEDVARLARTLRDRVLRLLRRRRLLDERGELTGAQEHEHQGLLPLLYAASIQGRVARRPGAGSRLARLGRIAASRSRFAPKALCGELDGFSLHAAVTIPPGDRDRLEHLCRYVARPPFAAGRLARSCRRPAPTS